VIIIRNTFFRQTVGSTVDYRKENRSEVEILPVGKLWWEIDAHYSMFAFSQCCTQDPRDEATLLVK